MSDNHRLWSLFVVVDETVPKNEIWLAPTRRDNESEESWRSRWVRIVNLQRAMNLQQEINNIDSARFDAARRLA